MDLRLDAADETKGFELEQGGMNYLILSLSIQAEQRGSAAPVIVFLRWGGKSRQYSYKNKRKVRDEHK